MRFQDIIGHRPIINHLIDSVEQGRIAHAQLFVGPEGNFKTALAFAYAQYINCLDPIRYGEGAELKGDSCGKCSSCLKFEKLAHPDLKFVFPNNQGELCKKDSQSSLYLNEWREYFLENQGEFSYNGWLEHIKIGGKQGLINVRDCQDILQTLGLKVAEAKYRIIFIWLAEKINAQIAAYLLKTLEEPSPGNVILLVSENQEQIITTILSRTQIIHVPKLSVPDMERELQEKYRLDAEKAHSIAIHSQGNWIEARHRLNSTQENIYHEYFMNWMRICYSVNMLKILEFSNQLQEMGRENIKFFFKNCLNEFHYCLLMQNDNARWVLLDNAEEVSFIKNFSKFINHQNIKQYQNLIENGIRALEGNAYIPILVTHISLDLCRLIAACKKK